MERYRFSDSERKVMEGLKAPFAVYQFLDERVVTLILSEGFLDLFGYSDKEQAYYDMDHNMYKAVHPEDSARAADAALRFATKGDPLDVTYRSKKKDSDKYIVIHSMGEHVYTESGVRLAHVWYTDEGLYSQEDSPEKKNSHLDSKEIASSGRYEHLTGLPNISYYFDLAAPRRDSMLKKGQHPACLFMNFSGMRYYNRRHGFAEGDKLLISFARLLADFFGNENCCRTGGDHFTVLTDDEGLEEKLERFFEAEKNINEGLSLPIHVGIHLQRHEDVNVGVAFDRAKLACDSLKGRYASTFSYYDVSMSGAEERAQYVIANVDKAIREGWIQVYYQPLVRAVNGKVCDEEALVRWIDPVYGFLPPSDFLSTLEDARLIYKLDMHVVDLVLEKLKLLKEKGLYTVPQSINLSRADFDCCDIVEEIRKRVEREGVDCSMINIEITESIIGDDFDFIKEQIARFHKLGFKVWMDDFGSGYSSLDVLQSLDFDLLKFDMQFLRNFDKGARAKIILTQLIEMAAGLGIDTVCEGVETLEHVRFLREAGCSMLQGYYYCKPIPVEAILQRYEKGEEIGFENPEDTQYYEAVGKLNLHDLAMISQEEDDDFGGFFNTTPMAIIEIRGRRVRFMRNNEPFREYMQKYMGMEVSEVDPQFSAIPKVAAASYMRAAALMADGSDRQFIDEPLPDGSMVHYFVRRIAENPRRKTVAIAIAILSVIDAKQGATYASIARALAADYFNLFYVNIETEEFIEYSSRSGRDDLAFERHDTEFFAQTERDSVTYIHPTDLADFQKTLTKENVMEIIREQGVFTITYRVLTGEDYIYANMKIMRMINDDKHIIVAISNVDSQMKQKVALENARRDRTIYNRMSALSGNYLGMYVVDPETEEFSEYSATAAYEELGIAKTGKDFFKVSAINSEATMSREDSDRFKEFFTKDNILGEIKEKGIFSENHRLVIEGKTIRTNIRAALVKEDNGEKLIVGISSLGDISP